MLRSKISRIKRLCMLVIIPNFGRGIVYSRNAHVKLSAHIRKAENSTTSGSSSSKDVHCEKCKKIIEFVFGPSKNTQLNIGDKNQKPEFRKTPEHQLHIEDVCRGNMRDLFSTQVNVKNENPCKNCTSIINKVFDANLPSKETEQVKEVSILQTTTRKENDEKLMQKLEKIEETPLVETEKPILEGFNVSPKVLGDAVNANFSKHLKEDIPYYKNCNENNLCDGQRNCFDKREDPSMKVYIKDELKNGQIDNCDDKNIAKNSKVVSNNLVSSSKFQNCTCKHHSENNIYNPQHNSLDNKKIKTQTCLQRQSYNFTDDLGKNTKTGSTVANTQICIDELARKRLDSRSNKMDEHLFQEMEKSDLHDHWNRINTSILHDVVQIDAQNKSEKASDNNEINVESKNTGKETIYSNNDCEQKLYPPYEVNCLEKQIIKEDIETSELKSEKPIQHSIYNLKNVEEATDEEINSNTKINTEFCNKQLDESSDKLRMTPKLIDEIYAQPNVNKVIKQFEIKNYLYNKQTDVTTRVESDNCTESPVSTTSYIKPIQFENSIHSQNKLVHDITHNKSDTHEVGIEKPNFPVIKANDFLDSAKTRHEDPTHVLATRSFEINQSPKDNYDENSLSRDNVAYYFDKKTLVEKITSDNYYKNTKDNEISHLSDCDKAEKHSTPVATKEKSNLKPCGDSNVSNVAVPQMIYIDRKSDPTKQVDIANNETEETTNAVAPAVYDANDNRHFNNKPKQSEQIKIDYTIEDASKRQILNISMQPGVVTNPLTAKVEIEPESVTKSRLQDNLSSLGPLPKLKGKDVTLSQLLRKIRERNKMKQCEEFENHTLSSQATEIIPVEGGCGDKTPKCPPPAPECPPKNPCPPLPCPPPPCPKPDPPCPPKDPCPPPPKPICPPPAPKCPPKDPCPPPPCPPPPPPCPKPCKPKCPAPCPPPKKSPCDKFIKKCASLEYIIHIISYQRTLSSDKICKLQSIRWILKALTFDPSSDCAVDSCNEVKQNLTLARDFKPWTPIPSWPLPKKDSKRPLVCPKDGYKVLPPIMPDGNEQCKPKQYPGYPKRTLSFTNLEVYERCV